MLLWGKYREKEWAGLSGKGKFIRGKWEGDWSLRRTASSLSDAGEIIGCHLGNLVSLTDHGDFIFCLQGQHNKPSYQWDARWALSIRTLYDCFWPLLKLEQHCSGCSETSLWQEFPVAGRVIRPPFLGQCQTGDSGISCLSIFNINTWVCQS